MKNLYSVNSQLRMSSDYQSQIATLSVGDFLTLKIVKKTNGYNDVFAYHDGLPIGEFFAEESRQLFPYVNEINQFNIDVYVKKIHDKDNGQKSVIVDVVVKSDDNFDNDKFLATYKKAPDAVVQDIAQNESHQPPKKTKNKGCLRWVGYGFLALLFFFLVGKCSNDFFGKSGEIEKTKKTNTVKIKTVDVEKNQEEAKKLTPLFSEKKDDFESFSWVSPKSKPQFSNVNGFYCYFAKDSSGVHNLRFRGQYANSDWLFVDALKFNIDGETIDYYPNDVSRDNDSTIWEWYDDLVDAKAFILLSKIANAKSVKVRWIGRQYKEDRTMSSANILSIKNTLAYYKALGGVVTK